MTSATEPSRATIVSRNTVPSPLSGEHLGRQAERRGLARQLDLGGREERVALGPGRRRHVPRAGGEVDLGQRPGVERDRRGEHGRDDDRRREQARDHVRPRGARSRGRGARAPAGASPCRAGRRRAPPPARARRGAAARRPAARPSGAPRRAARSAGRSRRGPPPRARAAASSVPSIQSESRALATEHLIVIPPLRSARGASPAAPRARGTDGSSPSPRGCPAPQPPPRT